MAPRRRISNDAFYRIWMEAYEKDPDFGLDQVVERTGLTRKRCHAIRADFERREVSLPRFRAGKTDWDSLREQLDTDLDRIRGRKKKRAATKRRGR